MANLSKEIRNQVRNVVKEILRDVLTKELTDEIYAKINKVISERLDLLDERQKRFHGLMVRSSLANSVVSTKDKK